MRPSTYTCEPFFRYSPAISARRPKKAMRCHSVASFVSPLALSFQRSVVARRMFVTASPLGRYFDSGSAPRLPTRMTLFTDAISCLPAHQFTYGSLVPLAGDDLEPRDALLAQHLRLSHARDGGERAIEPFEIDSCCDAKRETREIVDRAARLAHAQRDEKPKPA